MARKSRKTRTRKTKYAKRFNKRFNKNLRKNIKSKKFKKKITYGGACNAGTFIADGDGGWWDAKPGQAEAINEFIKLASDHPGEGRSQLDVRNWGRQHVVKIGGHSYSFKRIAEGEIGGGWGGAGGGNIDYGERGIFGIRTANGVYREFRSFPKSIIKHESELAHEDPHPGGRRRRPGGRWQGTKRPQRIS